MSAITCEVDGGNAYMQTVNQIQRSLYEHWPNGAIASRQRLEGGEWEDERRLAVPAIYALRITGPGKVELFVWDETHEQGHRFVVSWPPTTEVVTNNWTHEQFRMWTIPTTRDQDTPRRWLISDNYPPEVTGWLPELAAQYQSAPRDLTAMDGPTVVVTARG